MSGSRRLAVCIALVMGLCPGCSTVRSLSSDDPTTPKIYGGVRLHLKDQSEADSGAKQLGGKILAAIFDLPFSAIFDTLLLPVTVFLEPDSPEEIKRKSERERWKEREEREEREREGRAEEWSARGTPPVSRCAAVS